MVVASPPLLLSAAGIVHPSRTFRQSLGAMFRSGTAALSAAAGAIHGPVGTVGELTLVTDALLRVNPAVWVVNGSRSTKQGQYIVPNDDLVDLAVPAKDAALSRRVLVAVTVNDSLEDGTASSAANDRAFLQLVSGALAASNPALPATPANTLLLGELTVPSTASGQPVTVTPYNPRTTMRGGILPVINDTATTPGHAGAPGTHVGQYRDHPTFGTQRWNGTAWKTIASAPVRLETVSASATWATPGPNQIAQTLTVDPVALFGPGHGARVLLAGVSLIDGVTGTSDWYYNLRRSDGALLGQDFARAVTTRAVFHSYFTADVGIGQVYGFYPELSAPGTAAGAATIRTYADFTSNTLIANVWPL